MKNDVLNALRQLLMYYSTNDTAKYNKIKEILKENTEAKLDFGIMQSFNKPLKIMEIFKKMFGIKKDDITLFNEAKSTLETLLKSNDLDIKIKDMLERILKVIQNG